MSEFVLDFFEGKNLATIEKKKHSYLMIDGHDQADIYILKDGIVKMSIILNWFKSQGQISDSSC